MRRGLLVIALAIVACEGPPPRPQPIDEQYALTLLHLDALTEIGNLHIVDPSLASQLGLVLGNASCDGPVPVLVDLDGERPDAGQLVGTLSMLVGALERGEPCDGSGVFEIIDDLSFGPDGEPLVSGPLYVQGRTGEARLPLGQLHPILRGFLPMWWTITARRSESSDALRYSEARTVWRVRDLARVTSGRDPTRSLLDEIVLLRAQPEIDVDGDGLERLYDIDGDGHVDRCIDGLGESWDGTECVADARIADGFDLAIRFRLVPATISGR